MEERSAQRTIPTDKWATIELHEPSQYMDLQETHAHKGLAGTLTTLGLNEPSQNRELQEIDAQRTLINRPHLNFMHIAHSYPMLVPVLNIRRHMYLFL